MEQINSTTKRGQRWIESYDRSTDSTLSDCYGRFSCAKARAERDCKNKMEKEGGEDFRIISYNTFGFSCGWRVPGGLRVETSGGSYLVS